MVNSKYIRGVKMKKAIIFSIVLFTFILILKFSSAMSIAIDIPEKYSEVQAGEKVYFQTEVKWPENDGRKDLRIEYSIKNSEGTEIAYLKVLKAVETQASFMDSISIPESTPGGNYKIYVNFNDYKDLSHEVAASFVIKNKTADPLQRYMLIGFGILVVITLVIVIELFVLIEKKK
jgi:hypothetical protein